MQAATISRQSAHARTVDPPHRRAILHQGRTTLRRFSQLRANLLEDAPPLTRCRLLHPFALGPVGGPLHSGAVLLRGGQGLAGRSPAAGLFTQLVPVAMQPAPQPAPLPCLAERPYIGEQRPPPYLSLGEQTIEVRR